MPVKVGMWNTKNNNMRGELMISNQILQSTIEGLKGITRVDLCVMDTEGKNLASTFEGAEQYEEAVLNLVESPLIARCFPAISSSRFLMNSSLNTLSLQEVTMMMCIWWGRLQDSRFRILLSPIKERV